MISFVVNYWFILVVVIAILAIAGVALMTFVRLPNSSKAKKVREWLLYAVMEAEKELGSGTGQMKLRYVYNLAISKFPIFIKLLPFETFSKFVDNALETFEKMIEDSEMLKNYIGKEDKNND